MVKRMEPFIFSHLQCDMMNLFVIFVLLLLLLLLLLILFWRHFFLSINRADIKQYIGPPSVNAIFSIYHSCIAELMRVRV